MVVFTQPDYPHLRNGTWCPFYNGFKPVGNIACWPCYGTEDLRHGETMAQKLLLDVANEAQGNLAKMGE